MFDESVSGMNKSKILADSRRSGKRRNMGKNDETQEVEEEENEN